MVDISDTTVVTADDNVIQPFSLDASNLRGRSVRLGSVLDDILKAHDYPNPVAHLVAETATLALLLSSMLKYDGIFTLQTQGDGPVGMLVADVTSAGDVRACATFDADRVEIAREQINAMRSRENSHNHLAQYLGKGYIAFTVDQGPNTERYQGIVELKGASLVDCVQHYFTQSEQIQTGIKMAAGQRDDVWRSGAIMVQHMPDEETETASNIVDLDADDWRRVMVLLDTATKEEFLDADLHSNTLLHRLFHEEEVRVYEPIAVQKQCRCDVQRVENVLLTMSPEEREYMVRDGKISMRCEFCSTDYDFDPAEIEKKYASLHSGTDKSGS